MYKPSLPRFIHDICTALMVFIIIYFVGISVHNLIFSILFSIFGLIIILSLLYLPIALYTININFRNKLYFYYYFMIFIYFTMFSTLLILKVMFK
jgi:hypothetical protein